MCVVLLFVRLFVNWFVCCFFLGKTQRGSGSQESAVERRLGPCAVVCVCVLGVCPSMVVLVLSVQCLPPSSLLPLSDVVCHVTQCVLRCRMTVLAEAGRCPLSLSLSLSLSPRVHSASSLQRFILILHQV